MTGALQTESDDFLIQQIMLQILMVQCARLRAGVGYKKRKVIFKNIRKHATSHQSEIIGLSLNPGQTFLCLT